MAGSALEGARVAEALKGSRLVAGGDEAGAGPEVVLPEKGGLFVGPTSTVSLGAARTIDLVLAHSASSRRDRRTVASGEKAFTNARSSPTDTP